MKQRWATAAIMVLLVAFCVAVPRLAAAHGFRPGVLTLRELDPGSFSVTWTAPMDTSSLAAAVDVAFPSSCDRDGGRLECPAAGLRGEVTFAGLEGQRAPVATRVAYLDGRVVETMVWPENPVLILDRTHVKPLSGWIAIGMRHVAGGVDHIAFLLGLLLVVGFRSARRLLATTAAFTLGHASSLALAALGWVQLASGPVEAIIAASVVLVAREAMDDKPSAAGTSQPTLTRRWPWAVALVFGLVHGLGFAGAFVGAGLGTRLGWGVVLFNVGVELGQLGVVLLAFGAVRLLDLPASRLRPALCYVLGGAGAFWFAERTWAMLTAVS